MIPFVITMIAFLTGCSTAYTKHNRPNLTALELAEKTEEIERLQKENQEQRIALASLKQKSERSDLGDLSVYPKNAKPGECFAKVSIPARYAVKTVNVLKTPAKRRIKSLPAKYRTVTRRIEVVPARSKTIQVPAEYAKVSERVLVEPERTEWKKQTNSLGNETMCKVVIPAKFKTVTKEVVKRPSYEKTIEVPAQYKTVKVREIVSPERPIELKVPAKYETVRQKIKISESRKQWAPILCNENADRKTVKSIQMALQKDGYQVGRIDGVLGKQTLNAVRSYQIKNDLAQGALTLETVRALKL